MQKIAGVLAFGACLLLVMGFTGCPQAKDGAATKAVQVSVVDFEGLPAGTIVSSLSSGAGISGPLVGSVGVLGFTPGIGSNTSVIFDSSDPSGEDDDLGTANENFGGPGISTDGSLSNDTPLGNILILAEDLVDTSPADGLVDDPDDTFFSGATTTFDFSGVNGAVVKVLDMTVLDVENNEGGAFVQVSGPTLPAVVIPILSTGDNGAATVVINAAGVDTMIVSFNGSGAIGEFQIEQEIPDDDGGFRTQTQGGWGTRCRGNNPGCFRDANFDTCFPDGLLIGCEPGNSILLTSSKAVQDFLPQGKKARALKNDFVDPTSKITVLAGQVAALSLSVGFDLCVPGFGENSGNLADLVVIDNSSDCFGMTVQQVLDEGNKILGGCDSSFSASEINDSLSKINENYVDGKNDNGFLG
jgi:hypothetical protein